MKCTAEHKEYPGGNADCPTEGRNHITNFADLPKRLLASGRRVRVAVACPADAHTEEVVARAIGEGFADFTLVAVEGRADTALRLQALSEASAAESQKAGGQSEHSENVPGAESRQPARVTVIQAADERTACQQAVREVHEGRADVLMKGTVNTDVLLRAVLDKQEGLLRQGQVLTHVAIAQLPRLGRLLLFTDAAVIPFPTLQQHRAMLGYAADTFRSVVGKASPRVALTHCTEKTSDKFPVTLSYAALKTEAADGAWGSLVVDGPMDVKTALDSESGSIKGIASPVVGQADILIFPDIEAGNTFYKTLTLLAPTTVVAGMLCGTTAPVVVTSRADTAESKYYSLVAACAKAINK